MDRYSFGTYLVDEYNQEAFSLCHDVANLRAKMAMPIVLIGDTGTGKTHLLYSIVARIRTSDEPTGIAYVTANEIPDSVRNLLEHPAPVKDARQAVLLVDHLESFQGDIDVLERIIRLFLENEHTVVCASNIHPARLSHFPGSFAKLLDDGHRVMIQPQDSPSRIELLENTIREEQDAIIARLETEIDELKQFVTSRSEIHDVDEDEDESLLLGLRKELEVSRAELEVAQAKLSGQSLTIGSSKPEETLSPDVHELLAEIEQLRAENALNAVASKEVSALRKRMRSLELDRDELREQSHGQESAASAKGVSTAQRSRKEAKELVAQAEDMIHEMQNNREKFTQAQKVHQQQLSEMKQLENIFRNHEENHGAADSEELNTLTERFAQAVGERDDAQGQYESLLVRLTSLETERDSVHCELVDQKSELNLCKQDLKEAQGLLTEKTESLITIDMNMEQLRVDQAGVTDRFNAEITQYEKRLTDYQSKTVDAQKNEAFMEGELISLQVQLNEVSERVQRIVSSSVQEEPTPVPEPPASIH